MGGSTCIIAMLLLMVVLLQTFSWKVLAAVMQKRMQGREQLSGGI